MEEQNKNIKILIVDDEPNFREIIRFNLINIGFSNLEEASNGVEALQKIQEFKPDLVILDIIMPKKDGIETALEIKAKEETKDTKFVFLTNLGEDILTEDGRLVDEKIAKELGALDFFRKTDDFSILVEKIKKILAISQ